MLGISYGELLLLLGATAAVIGPKDLPIIARTAGRLAGRAIGYVQLARGQFETVMQQSQARQVHKELQDTIAQLDAIRHEIRSISIMNPGPLTRSLVDNPDHASSAMDAGTPKKTYLKDDLGPNIVKDFSSTISHPFNLHSQATSFEKLADCPGVKNGQTENTSKIEKNDQETDHLSVLPVSAESVGLLPNRKAAAKVGSDIILEAILEAEVAHNAKEFFSQPQNQIKYE